MCFPTLTADAHEQVTAESSSAVTRIVLPWMIAFTATTLLVIDEMQAKSGLLVQAVQHRFAQVDQRQPGAWTVSSTTRSANGVGVQSIDISGTTDQAFVQVALTCKATSGVAEALSGLRAQSNCAARVIASRMVEVQPTVNSGEAQYIVLTDPLPALGLSKMMFVIIWSGVAGSLGYRPAWRTITADPNTPNVWVDLDSTQTISGDAFYNSGTETTAPASGEAYFQPGLKITGTGGRGTAQILVLAAW